METPSVTESMKAKASQSEKIPDTQSRAGSSGPFVADTMISMGAPLQLFGAPLQLLGSFFSSIKDFPSQLWQWIFSITNVFSKKTLTPSDETKTSTQQPPAAEGGAKAEESRHSHGKEEEGAENSDSLLGAPLRPGYVVENSQLDTASDLNISGLGKSTFAVMSKK